MATPLQWGHREATPLPPGYNLVWIKSCSIFSQSRQRLFLNDTWYPHSRLQSPPTAIQLETHLKKGMRGRGGLGGGMDECCCGGVCEGSDARAAHLCPAATHDCLHVFTAVCVSRSTWPATVRKLNTYSEIVGVVAAVKRRGRRVNVELPVSSVAVKTDSC